jgi:hypothetical protein
VRKVWRSYIRFHEFEVLPLVYFRKLRWIIDASLPMLHGWGLITMSYKYWSYLRLVLIEIDPKQNQFGLMQLTTPWHDRALSGTACHKWYIASTNSSSSAIDMGPSVHSVLDLFRYDYVTVSWYLKFERMRILRLRLHIRIKCIVRFSVTPYTEQLIHYWSTTQV